MVISAEASRPRMKVVGIAIYGTGTATEMETGCVS